MDATIKKQTERQIRMANADGECVKQSNYDSDIKRSLWVIAGYSLVDV